MNILTFSTLYPNNIQTRHGIFVETRLRHLKKHTGINSIVVAPVPWVPFKSRFFGDKAKLADISPSETREGIEIYHPRYLVIPKIGMYITPFFLALSSYFTIKRILKNGYEFDVIDAHYFFPDGIAAVILSKIFKKPVTITARGTDLSLIPNYPIARKMIQWVFKHASFMMTVCEDLRQKAIALGADPHKIKTLRNGVDLERFTPPKERTQLRKELSISGNTIISVGHLIERKGHHLIIEAIKDIDSITLLIAGDGEEQNNLIALCKKLDIEHKVKFLGALTQAQLKKYYGACDMLVLASSREGWANVILESLACGTPVIATDAGGTSEVIQTEQAGTVINREVKAIHSALLKGFKEPLNRTQVRTYAEKFGWLPTSEGQIKIFNALSNK